MCLRIFRLTDIAEVAWLTMQAAQITKADDSQLPIVQLTCTDTDVKILGK
jgi:hypothetical protein